MFSSIVVMVILLRVTLRAFFLIVQFHYKHDGTVPVYA